MSPFSVDALALDELVAMLDAIAADDDLGPEQKAKAVFAAFMVTPHLWPLDHTMFEALLRAGGFDLNDSAMLERITVVAAQLEGSGRTPMRCDHTDPTVWCRRVVDAAEARRRSAMSALAGQYDELLNMRRLRAVGLRWRAESSSAF